MASTSAAEPSSATKESPNWLEMPDEVMVNIFQRLPNVEVLKSARKVCTTWWRICKYPAMWKVIEMLKPHDDLDTWDKFKMLKSGKYRNWYEGLETLTKEAVDLSCGELIDISIELFGTDELLDHIVMCSKKLKSLCIVSCFEITESVLSVAVKRLPQLEKLQLRDTIISPKAIKDIGGNCPQLKSFTMKNMITLENMITEINMVDHDDDYAFAIADSMPGLCHLEVFDRNMTNNGLQAILDGCPHLQSLHLQRCFNLDLDGDLGKMCMERIKDFKHDTTLPSEISDEEDFHEGDFYDDILESDFYEDCIL